MLLDALPDRNAEQKQLDAIKKPSHREEIEIGTEELVSIMQKLQKRKRESVSLLDLVGTLVVPRGQLERKNV